MELYQIRQFVAVAETGSFTKGAARAAVSQPAISAAIAKLEEEMGQKLFDRRQGSVFTTPAGERLLDAAKGILLACSTIKSSLRAASTPDILRVGVLRTLPTIHVASILETFRDAHPDVLVELFEGTREEIEQRLTQKKLHVCLTSLQGRDSKNSAALFTEPYALAVNTTHRLAKLKSIALADLEGERFILRTGCETFRDTTALFLSKGIRTRIVYRTDQDDRALGLVAAGLGVALMPMIYHAPGVINIPIRDFTTTRTIGLRWLTRSPDHKSLNAMIAFAGSHAWNTDLFSGEKRKAGVRSLNAASVQRHCEI